LLRGKLISSIVDWFNSMILKSKYTLFKVTLIIVLLVSSCCRGTEQVTFRFFLENQTDDTIQLSYVSDFNIDTIIEIVPPDRQIEIAGPVTSVYSKCNPINAYDNYPDSLSIFSFIRVKSDTNVISKNLKLREEWRFGGKDGDENFNYQLLIDDEDF